MMGEMEIPDELIDQLLGEYRGVGAVERPAWVDQPAAQAADRACRRRRARAASRLRGWGGAAGGAAEPAQRRFVEDVAHGRGAALGRAAARPRRELRAADRAEACSLLRRLRRADPRALRGRDDDPRDPAAS